MVAFGTLALQCAPAVALDLLAALVAVESGFDALAINASGVVQTHAQVGMAVAGAVDAGQQGGDFGVGLAGVRFADLPVLGLSVGEAFDACKNLTAFEGVVRSRFEAADRKGFGPSAADKFVIRSSWRPDGRFVSSEAFEKAVQAERGRVSVHAKIIVRGAVMPPGGQAGATGAQPAKSESASVATIAVAAVPPAPSVRERKPAAWEVFPGNRPPASRSLTVFSKSVQPAAGSQLK
jgi:type IV secretion system protein VirB1